MKIISRQEAKNKNLKIYFTNIPCSKGHFSTRITSSGVCTACANINTNNYCKTRYKKDKKFREKVKQRANQRYAKFGTKWHHENKKWAAELNKQYRLNHPDIIKKARDTFRKNNSEKILADVNKRRSDKQKATPPWFEKDQIVCLYKQAKLITKQTGIKHHVDHIIPIKGYNKTTKKYTVCGLHCLDNLQIIPAVTNLYKNKYIEDV